MKKKELILLEEKLVLDPDFNKMKVVTDMVREENGKKEFFAGAKIIELLRQNGYGCEVGIY